jgi:hypothetical protein
MKWIFGRFSPIRYPSEEVVSSAVLELEAAEPRTCKGNF